MRVLALLVIFTIFSTASAADCTTDRYQATTEECTCGTDTCATGKFCWESWSSAGESTKKCLDHTECSVTGKKKTEDKCMCTTVNTGTVVCEKDQYCQSAGTLMSSPWKCYEKPACEDNVKNAEECMCASKNDNVSCAKDHYCSMGKCDATEIPTCKEDNENAVTGDCLCGTAKIGCEKGKYCYMENCVDTAQIKGSCAAGDDVCLFSRTTCTTLISGTKISFKFGKCLTDADDSTKHIMVSCESPGKLKEIEYSDDKCTTTTGHTVVFKNNECMKTDIQGMGMKVSWTGECQGSAASSVATILAFFLTAFMAVN